MGLCLGHGFYTLGLIAGTLIFVVLSIITPIENHLLGKSRAFAIHVELNSRPNLKELINFLRKEGFQVSNVEHNLAYASSGLSVYSISLISPAVKRKKAVSHKVVCSMIKELEYVNHVEVQQ